MKRCTITLSSITYALKAQQLSSALQMGARTVALDPSRTKKGCGYGIEVDCGRLRAMLSELERSGIPYSEVLRD